MSAFTCAACGGFKYNQTPVMRGGPHDLICQDCYENGAMDAPGTVPMLRARKPGLHEVLLSIFGDCFYNKGYSFADWIAYNGGSEENTAAILQQYERQLWRDHYRLVTGEDWV